MKNNRKRTTPAISKKVLHSPLHLSTSGKNHFHEMNGDVVMAGWK